MGVIGPSAHHRIASLTGEILDYRHLLKGFSLVVTNRGLLPRCQAFRCEHLLASAEVAAQPGALVPIRRRRSA